MKLWMRIGLACLGVGVMWLESRFTPDPGIGFAVALALMCWSVLAD